MGRAQGLGMTGEVNLHPVRHVRCIRGWTVIHDARGHNSSSEAHVLHRRKSRRSSGKDLARSLFDFPRGPNTTTTMTYCYYKPIYRPTTPLYISQLRATACYGPGSYSSASSSTTFHTGLSSPDVVPCTHPSYPRVLSIGVEKIAAYCQR